MKGKSGGFTLVELMIAALLAGIALIIALPLILVGRNTDVRAEKEEAIALAGEAIYEFVADEIKFAGRLYIGDLTERKPSGENWKSIMVSEKSGSEAYSRLLYGPARELTEEAADKGNPLYDLTYQEKTDLVIEAEAAGRNQLRLTVKLMYGEEALYEKSSVLSLLNLSLNATSQIEGYIGGVQTTDVAEGENPLVLWYQSSKDTVNPFADDRIEGAGEGDLPTDSGTEVVSLANPQYVKVGEMLNVQFKAQAKGGKEIIRYDWSLDNNESEDSGDYVEDPVLWDEDEKTATIKGLKVTEGDADVRLTLVVTYNDGTNAQDSCTIIVYDGNMPGEGPVQEFVIVPEGQEEEYVQVDMANTPIWIRNGKTKKIYLVAVDDRRMITEYSPDNWRSFYNFDQKSYCGFHNDSWLGVYVSLDGRSSLENGTKVDPEKDWNYVEAKATNIDTSYTPRNNSTYLVFGGPNGPGTAYFPLGKNMVTVSRYVNIYDIDCEWRYGIDKNERDMKGVNGKTIKVEAENEFIDLEIIPEIKTENKVDGNSLPRYDSNAGVEGIPQIDEKSVIWKLNGSVLFDGEFVQRFQIKQTEEPGNPQLRTGENSVEYTFCDTAGEEYSGEMTIQVPQTVSEVKLNVDSITLLKLEGVDKWIQGLTAQNIEIMLFNEDGEELLRSLIEDFTIEWIPTSSTVYAINSGSGGSELATPTITPKNVGADTLRLRLTERLPSDGQIHKVFEAECRVEVVDLQLNLQLLTRVLGDEGIMATVRTPIQDGSIVYLTEEMEKDVIGVSAEISLPGELKGKENLLAGTDWNRIKEWEITGETSLFNRELNPPEGPNDCTGTFSNSGKETGDTIIFSTVALRDSGLKGTVSFVTGADHVNVIKIRDINGQTNASLSVSSNAPLILHVSNMHATGNRPFDPRVIWKIIKGREFLDMEESKMIEDSPVDYQNKEFYPNLRLKKDLPNTAIGKRQIVITAISVVSPGTSDTYEIDIIE